MINKQQAIQYLTNLDIEDETVPANVRRMAEVFQRVQDEPEHGLSVNDLYDLINRGGTTRFDNLFVPQKATGKRKGREALNVDGVIEYYAKKHAGTASKNNYRGLFS